MKKVLVASLLFIFSFSNVFAYTPTIKDEKALNNLYKQLDILVEKKPNQVERLYEKVLKIIPTLKKDDKNKYLITSLWDYLSTKLNKEVSEESSTVLENYEVLEVIDGDTIKIKYNWELINIRMIWIDSPENSTTRFWYVQKFGDQAKDKLKELIWSNKISIELDETQWNYDKYNRLLAYVFVSWVNINQKMIELWYAKEYTYSKAYKYQNDFKNAQKNAEFSKIWIWEETSEETQTNTWTTTEVNTSTTTTTESTVKNTYSSSRNYYTWSRGGCYYYNSNWNKTYVSRSLCD